METARTWSLSLVASGTKVFSSKIAFTVKRPTLKSYWAFDRFRSVSYRCSIRREVTIFSRLLSHQAALYASKPMKSPGTCFRDEAQSAFVPWFRKSARPKIQVEKIAKPSNITLHSGSLYLTKLFF